MKHGLVLVLLLLAPFTASAQTLTAGGLTYLEDVYKYGPNLLINPGFETGITSWQGIDAAWLLDTTVSHSGAASLKLWNAPNVPYTQSAAQSVTVHTGVYRLRGWIKTENAGTAHGGARLSLRVSPTAWSSTKVVTGTTGWQQVELAHVAVPADGAISVRLEAYADMDGTAWFDDLELVEEIPHPLETFLRYPNFRGMLFDDQPLRLTLDVTTHGDMTSYAMRVQLIEDATQAVVASWDRPAATGTLTLDVGAALTKPLAPYLLRLALVTGAGVEFYAPAPYRLSRVPAAVRATMTVAVNAKNQVMIRGTPRFILGVYDSGLGYSSSPAYWESTLFAQTGARRLGDVPINMYLNYWFGATPAPYIDALEDTLAKHGVLYLQTGNCFNDGRDTGFLIDTSDAYVQEIGARPGSGGYYVADECTPAMVPGTFAQYARLRRLDPDALTFGTLVPGPRMELWRESVDVLAVDPYPLWGAEPTGGYDHGQVARAAAQLRDGLKDARPWFMTLQFFQGTSNSRWPTRAEMRTHAIMSIVEGAKGLWWWSVGVRALAYSCASSAEWCDARVQRMSDLQAVIAELASLEPVLLADDAPAGTVTVSVDAIKTKVKRVEGVTYVFAYNTTPASVMPTFQLTGSTVTVEGEARELAGTARTFTDAIGPYAAHIYMLR